LENPPFIAGATAPDRARSGNQEEKGSSDIRVGSRGRRAALSHPITGAPPPHLRSFAHGCLQQDGGETRAVSPPW